MKFSACLRVEINRMFRSAFSWVFVILSVLSPLFGFTVFKLNGEQTAATQMIINPLLTGIIGSGILFALFTIFELDRTRKYKTAALTEAVAPPETLHAAKIVSAFCVSVATIAMTIFAYYHYTMINMRSFADPALYVSSYLIFMLPAMWIGIFLAAIFYQVSQRVDVSFTFVAACVLLNYSDFITRDFIFRWINPLLPVFSDGFGNAKPLRIGLYNRLFLLLFLGGFWLLSLLCTRKYEKGIFGSIAHNARKWYFPLAGAALLAASAYLYLNQPFFNKAPPEVDWEALHDTGPELRFDFLNAEIFPDVSKGTLRGTLTCVLNNDHGETVTRRMIINSGYRIYRMTINGESISHTDLRNDIFTLKHIEFAIPAGSGIELIVEYGGYPEIWGAYKTFFIGGAEISRDNIELRTHSLMPSLGAYDTTVRVNIVLPEHFTLIAEENSASCISVNNDGTKTWAITNSRDALEIYAADYAQRTIQAESMNAEFYFHRKFQDILEQNSVEEVLGEVFDYCSARFGPLHYLKNNMLRLIQSTAFNFGGGATPGVSEMSETNFSIYSLTDPWKGAAGREILAHEIIHQWWGLNRMIWENEDDPAWTSEGLTVYTTYRLYKEKYGEEYGRKNYVEKWEQAVEAMRRNFYYRHPEYLDRMPENFASRLRIRENETQKYSLMPLQIYKAAQLLGGEEAMDAILIALSDTNQGEPLTFQEFLDACGLTREELTIE
ncbi:MAG TPA: hypothetical protein DEQ14_09615 [Treponema sp.]|nr:hypothetical protein [Treponema sp.]